VVRVILGAGKFGWADTRLTTACLGILSLGLFAQGLIFILSKTFYASHNTKIPAIVSFVTVVVNIILSLFFVWMIKSFEWFSVFIQMLLKIEGVENVAVVGLPMAFSMAVILQCFLLLYLLYKKFFTRRSLGVGGPNHIKEFSDSLQKIIIASVAMVFAVLITRQILGMVLDLSLFWSVFFQLAISGIVGVAVYAFTTHKLKSEESKLILGSLLNKFIAK
jgi:putative peptidoglycan lipid II flippase